MLTGWRRGGSGPPDDFDPDGIWVGISTLPNEKGEILQKASELPIIAMEKWIEQALGTNLGRPLPDGRVLAQAKTMDAALKAIQNYTQFYNQCPIKIELMNAMNQKQGSIFGVSLLTETVETVKKALEKEGVVDVYRVEKTQSNEVKEGTGMHILTFEKQNLPAKVTVGYCRYEVRTHYPRPMRCVRCCKLRHTQKRCSSFVDACRNCEEIRHEGRPCIKPLFCRNCPIGKNDHSSYDIDCPEYKKEIVITRMKVDRNISFGQARAEYEKQFENFEHSYAEKLMEGLKTDAEKQANELEEVQKEREQMKTHRDEIKKQREMLDDETELLEIELNQLTEAIENRMRLKLQIDQLKQQMINDDMLEPPITTPLSAISTETTAIYQPASMTHETELTTPANTLESNEKQSNQVPTVKMDVKYNLKRRQQTKPTENIQKNKFIFVEIGPSEFMNLTKGLRKKIRNTVQKWDRTTHPCLFYETEKGVELEDVTDNEELKRAESFFQWIQNGKYYDNISD